MPRARTGWFDAVRLRSKGTTKVTTPFTPAPSGVHVLVTVLKDVMPFSPCVELAVVPLKAPPIYKVDPFWYIEFTGPFSPLSGRLIALEPIEKILLIP